MARRITIEPLTTLDQHAAHAHLALSVEELRVEAAPLARAMRGRTLWMINSTARGGGVSEMLPGMVGHLRELGINAEWAVIETDDAAFFELTKRIHNMIHGDGAPGLDSADRALLERVNRENADELSREIRDGDIVVIHDPQPLPLAGMLRETAGITAIWRCHIGLDQTNPATADAWTFLEPYAADYDHAVFSAPEYVPPYFEGKSSIIYPAIDPLSPKNRPLNVQSVVAVLGRSGLLCDTGPRVEPPFDVAVRRLQADGHWESAVRPDDLGLLTRPIITQVSRWDRLKGFLPLMRGFARLRERLRGGRAQEELMQRRLELSRLVLAGPDPESIADDPEGEQVLNELRSEYLACDADVRPDIALLALPMEDPGVNALIVNALQRVSTIVVQNSLREGFGLTVAEAMWKGVPVLSNSRACGPRHQMRDGVDGRLIADPEDIDAIADALQSMLTVDPIEEWGRNAQQRVHGQFLIYGQLQHWLRLLTTLTGAAKAA